MLLKWPLDAKRPERKLFTQTFIQGADTVIQHVEDLEDNPEREGPHHRYFNYMKDGFLFQLLGRHDFDAFCLKDDFDLFSMSYMIHANQRGRQVTVLSHGIKHSAESLREWSKRKVVGSRIFINLYRYGKLLLDFCVMGWKNGRILDYLSLFYWSFRFDKFTYVQKAMDCFQLKFDFYCLNQIDIGIQKKMVLGDLEHREGIAFKVMPFPYHKDIASGDLAPVDGADGVFVILTASVCVSDAIFDALSAHVLGLHAPISVKLHPMDYDNAAFIRKVKVLFGDAVVIHKNISDADIVRVLQQAGRIYAFYSTIILPIITQRDVIVMNESDAFKTNPTIADLWATGMIDLLNLSPGDIAIHKNPNPASREQYGLDYGFSSNA